MHKAMQEAGGHIRAIASIKAGETFYVKLLREMPIKMINAEFIEDLNARDTGITPQMFEMDQPLLVFYGNWLHIGRTCVSSDNILGLHPLFTAGNYTKPDKPFFNLREFYNRDFDLVDDFIWVLRPSPLYLGTKYIKEIVGFPEKEFDAILETLGVRVEDG